MSYDRMVQVAGKGQMRSALSRMTTTPPVTGTCDGQTMVVFPG